MNIIYILSLGTIPASDLTSLCMHAVLNYCGLRWESIVFTGSLVVSGLVLELLLSLPFLKLSCDNATTPSSNLTHNGTHLHSIPHMKP